MVRQSLMSGNSIYRAFRSATITNGQAAANFMVFSLRRKAAMLPSARMDLRTVGAPLSFPSTATVESRQRFRQKAAEVKIGQSGYANKNALTPWPPPPFFGSRIIQASTCGLRYRVAGYARCGFSLLAIFSLDESEIRAAELHRNPHVASQSGGAKQMPRSMKRCGLHY